MKKIRINLIMFLTFLTLLFFAGNAYAGTIALYEHHIIITGERGLTKSITVMAGGKKAKIVFKKSPDFKKKFNAFLKKTTYFFKKYGKLGYMETFKTNNDPSQNILINMPYGYNNKIYTELIFVYPNGNYSINKKFRNMFGRYISVKKSKKSLNITQFKNNYISVSLGKRNISHFGTIVILGQHSKVVGAYTPKFSSYIVYNKHNKQSIKYFNYLINKWIKQEKKFLNN
ncbi:MAG: hypothetical protein ACYCTB_10770 [bacterium]